jgi:hypothetical protein
VTRLRRLIAGLRCWLHIPNAETQQAMRDADAGKVIRYTSADEMFAALGIDETQCPSGCGCRSCGLDEILRRHAR